MFVAFLLFWLSPATDPYIEIVERWLIQTWPTEFDVLRPLFIVPLGLAWSATLILTRWLIRRDHGLCCPQCGAILTKLRHLLATHRCPTCDARVLETQAEDDGGADLPTSSAQLSSSSAWSLLLVLGLACGVTTGCGKAYYSGLRAFRPWVVEHLGDAGGAVLWALADTMALLFLIPLWVWVKRRVNDLTFCCCAHCLFRPDASDLIDQGRHCPECGRRLLRGETGELETDGLANEQ